MAKKTESEYLTIKQAAELKGVPVQTLYKAIERGSLKAETVLDKLVIRRAEAEAYTPRRRRARAAQPSGGAQQQDQAAA